MFDFKYTKTPNGISLGISLKIKKNTYHFRYTDVPPFEDHHEMLLNTKIIIFDYAIYHPLDFLTKYKISVIRFNLYVDTSINCLSSIETLKEIYVLNTLKSNIINKLPPNLKILKILYYSHNISCELPSSLIELEGKIRTNDICLLVKNCNKLKKLTLPVTYNNKIDNLPKSLEYLKLSDYFNKPIDNLPENLKVLKTGNNFNQNVDHLPENLQ